VSARVVAALVTAVLLSACWVATREEAGDPAPVIIEHPPATAAPEAVGVSDFPVQEGRYSAHLLRVDADTHTVEIDPFAFVTGKAARRLYDAEHPDEGGPPNDYVIVDLSTQPWRARVAEDVSVSLVRLAQDSDAGSGPGSFAELQDYLAALPGGTGPFWFEFRDGVVVQIEEQYLP
jgi:hypothetical protein